VYSSATWPANQQMCMHHELSYRLEVPSLLLFACLGAATRGGATAVSDSPTVLNALPKDLTEFEREGWRLTRSYNDEIGATWRRHSGPRIAASSKATAVPTQSSSRGNLTANSGRNSGAVPWCSTR
jgi:alpha-ketoglutarate-dependent taurine dioxygenase